MERKAVFSVLVGLAAAAGRSGDGLPSRTRTPTSAVSSMPPPGYGEVPFWWWTGEKLDKARLLWSWRSCTRRRLRHADQLCAHPFGRLAHRGGRARDLLGRVVGPLRLHGHESAKRGMGIGLSGYTLDWPGRDNLFRQLGITADELQAHVLAMSPRDVTAGADGVSAQPQEAAAVSVTAFALREGRPVPGSGVALDPQAAWASAGGRLADHGRERAGAPRDARPAQPRVGPPRDRALPQPLSRARRPRPTRP